jgi:hypothetical protein
VKDASKVRGQQSAFPQTAKKLHPADKKGI